MLAPITIAVAVAVLSGTTIGSSSTHVTGPAGESGQAVLVTVLDDGLPDTPRGELVAGFLQAYNSGSFEVHEAYQDAHRTDEARGRRTFEEREQMFNRLRGDFGDLTLKQVRSTGEASITTILEARNSGDLFEFLFRFDDADPPHLESIAISGPVSADVMTTDEIGLDEALIDDTVKGALRLLNESYVFPEVAADMEKAVLNLHAAGRYDDITSAAELASVLTEDLREVCQDRHLRVISGPMRRRATPTPQQMEEIQDERRRRNYGFEKVERLPGNVGYIKFDVFDGSRIAQETAAAAMEFLLNTDALIFDLRDNGGGSPEMINFISSYLFDEPVHLNSFYNRLSEQTSESWTESTVPGGRKYGQDKPIYVLTSTYTFSGAEEFSYNLRNLERATIVGEQTGGGAHPVQGMRINDSFSMMVPFARAVNPITGTNWEGVGVEPHIVTSREDALMAARRAAYQKLADTASSSDAMVEEWRRLVESLEDNGTGEVN